jgi:hypothetical protein
MLAAFLTNLPSVSISDPPAVVFSPTLPLPRLRERKISGQFQETN